MMLESVRRKLALKVYVHILQYLPDSMSFDSRTLKWWRLKEKFCKNIFKSCGNNVHIQRKVNFYGGGKLEIGNNSGIGTGSEVPYDIKIGNNVMIGGYFLALSGNHNFSRTDIPMIEQGMKKNVPRTIIEDDVWIGARVTLTPGRHLSEGTVVAAGSVVTKDFPPYSVIGGNPAQIIKTRK